MNSLREGVGITARASGWKGRRRGRGKGGIPERFFLQIFNLKSCSGVREVRTHFSWAQAWKKRSGRVARGGKGVVLVTGKWMERKKQRK